MRGKSVVTIANEQVPIVTVLQRLGVELPDDISGQRSLKVNCPFGGLYHSDNGVSPAMRVYPDTNSAYCFSCSAYFSPVTLAAQALDIDKVTAAQQLLDHVGYRPLDLATQWSDAVDYEPEPDKALLADALKTFCRRISPDWATRQFEPKIAAALTRCLSLIDLVHTADDVNLWLTSCKKVMEQALYRYEPSVSEKYSVLLEASDLVDGR